jgi:hypothetical protein
MKPTVFISSTYQDLAGFREEIWRVLSRENLNILGMEKFGARKSKPLKTCLDEVSKSNVYIGIIGTRYGSIEKETGKSFTQLEYEFAVANDLEIMIYIIDDECLVPLKHVDRGDKGEKLEEFKRYLKSNHTIDTFIEESQLAIKIFDRLKEILPSISDFFVRPKVIDCDIHRFSVGNELWLCFIGLYSGQIVEIYSNLGDEEIFPIPKSIRKGKIIKNKDDEGNTRYDFQYTDKYGYKNTMGGLDRSFDKEVQNYIHIINNLLRDGISHYRLFEYIDRMETHVLQPETDWKEGILTAIRECYG